MWVWTPPTMNKRKKTACDGGAGAVGLLGKGRDEPSSHAPVRSRVGTPRCKPTCATDPAWEPCCGCPPRSLAKHYQFRAGVRLLGGTRRCPHSSANMHMRRRFAYRPHQIFSFSDAFHTHSNQLWMNREKSLEKAGGVNEMHCQSTARPIDAAEQYIYTYSGMRTFVIKRYIFICI